jgi:hypothetical protein
MKISKNHSTFAKYLNDVLLINSIYNDTSCLKNNLGKNWKDVLNFWFYVDSLSRSEKKKIHNRFRRINPFLDTYGFDKFSKECYHHKLITDLIPNYIWKALLNSIKSEPVLYATLELLSDRKEIRVLPIFIL